MGASKDLKHVKSASKWQVIGDPFLAKTYGQLPNDGAAFNGRKSS